MSDGNELRYNNSTVLDLKGGIYMHIDTMNTVAIWKLIEEKANEDPGLNEGMDSLYAFILTGEDGGEFGLDFQANHVNVSFTSVENPDCTLKMSVKHFKKLIQGNLNGATAFMTGQLKVEGSITLALKLEKLLKKYSI